MAHNPQQPEPKLSEADIIIGTIFMLTLDAIDWVEVGIPGTDLVGFPLEQIFLSKKGVSGTTALVGNIIELIPGVDYLPVRSVAWLITAWMDRHPSEFSRKIEQVGQIAQVAKGKGGKASKALQAEVGAAEEAILIENEMAEEMEAGLRRESQGGDSSGGKGSRAEKSEERRILESESGSGSVRDRLQDGFGEGFGGRGTEGEEGEVEKPLTLEEQRAENAIKGLDIEDLELDVFSPEEILSDIGAPTLGTKVLKFDPDRAMQAKPAKEWAPANKGARKGIIDSEEINLKKKDAA